MQLCQYTQRRISELHKELLITFLKTENTATHFALLLLNTSGGGPKVGVQLLILNYCNNNTGMLNNPTPTPGVTLN